METYGGKYLYLIAGNRAWEGKDLGEIIIENPEVIMVIQFLSEVSDSEQTKRAALDRPELL
mgnify:FL=1